MLELAVQLRARHLVARCRSFAYQPSRRHPSRRASWRRRRRPRRHPPRTFFRLAPEPPPPLPTSSRCAACRSPCRTARCDSTARTHRLATRREHAALGVMHCSGFTVWPHRARPPPLLQPAQIFGPSPPPSNHRSTPSRSVSMRRFVDRCTAINQFIRAGVEARRLSRPSAASACPSAMN